MVWLIGNKGMLGSEIQLQLEANQISCVCTDRDVDITNKEALGAFAENHEGIRWIVNCAAYTAVDKAEEEPELAEKLNAIGAGNIAETARKIGAEFIHISTDYVFDGTAKTPYTENMPMAPLGVYGKTKAQGEELVLKAHPDAYIFRTAWLYGPRGKNFVYTMVNLMNTKDTIKVVNDQFGSPTCTIDLARYIVMTILGGQDIPGNPHKKIPSGIYHCTGEGETSWFHFAQEIYKIGREKNIITKECQVLPCTTEEFGAKVKRPAYSVLSKAKLKKALQQPIPQWQESLRAFMSSPMFRESL